ncbi:MAG: ABC transporter ATP-binding protein [Prevotellaceae bacterium]|jgi:ABC-type multidrug transport system ATPase subunit|nr:ABC transporter ATP-binding protein [Prevotellaceae bacterium]
MNANTTVKPVICRSVGKKYGNNIVALNNISFEAEYGEIFGLIGPDGAGKTSIFHILATLALPSKGSASVLGFDTVSDFRQIRQLIGYMPGRFSLYQDLTVEENLRFFATLFNTTVEANYKLVKDIYSHIEAFAKRRAGALSGGMKQKLALSCALIHKPKVLFLDEPTTGVDPVSRKEFWGMLKRLKEQGITIIVSTPYMDEATMCDRIALINRGAFMKIDTPAAIVESYAENLFAVRGNRMANLLKLLRSHSKVKTSFAFGDVHHVTVESDTSIDEIKRFIDENNSGEVEIYSVEPTIEDCYMWYSLSEDKKTEINNKVFK